MSSDVVDMWMGVCVGLILLSVVCAFRMLAGWVRERL